MATYHIIIICGDEAARPVRPQSGRTLSTNVFRVCQENLAEDLIRMENWFVANRLKLNAEKNGAIYRPEYCTHLEGDFSIEDHLVIITIWG